MQRVNHYINKIKSYLKEFDSPNALDESIFFKRFDKLGKWLPVFASIMAAILIGFGGLKPAIGLVVLIWAIPILLLIIFDNGFGVLLVIFLAFWVNFVGRRSPDIPFGVLIDLVTALSFFGIFLRQVRERDWSFAKGSISVIILIWMFYCVFQLANPWAESRLAWVYTIRGLAGILIIFFITLSAAKNLRFVNQVFIAWILLALIGAIYALVQEFSGLSDFELAWVKKDELRFKLLYNWGRFRVFSIFSDPTVLGILMAVTSVFCFTLCFSSLKIGLKFILIFIAVAMLMAMVYTGTRTAYAIIPIGVLFFSVLTFKRNILIATGVFLVLGATIILAPIKSLGPISSNSLNRIRSAFSPGEDDSYKVREKNQAFIQPYIQKHPIGGGLGSTGVWGARFSPNSELSKFPPDSGFVKVAVEMGWIGLALYCAMFFIILKVSIENYYIISNKLIKVYQASLTTVIFMLVVANFPQQSIYSYPTIVIFYICVALVEKLREIDKNYEINKSAV